MAHMDESINLSQSQGILQFTQAMKDFRAMFPSLDPVLIESALRANDGHVNSTVEQLLQLSRDSILHSDGGQYHCPNLSLEDFENDEISAGSTIFSIRERPPTYSQHSNISANFHTAKMLEQMGPCLPSSFNQNNKYRAWNPPMLGVLPKDFLRLLPQQFGAVAEKERLTKQRPSLYHQQHQFVSKPILQNLMATKDTSAIARALGLQAGRSRMSDSMFDGTSHYDIVTCNDNLLPQHSPHIAVEHDSRKPIAMGHVEGNIKGETSHRSSIMYSSMEKSQDDHNRSFENCGVRKDRSRNRHHLSRKYLSRSHTDHRPSDSFSDHYHQKYNNRNSNLMSRRTILVSHLSESSITNLRHESPSEILPRFDNALSVGKYTKESFSNQQELLKAKRSINQTSSDTPHFVEDCRLAILLQNEEFIQELKKNDEFLKELEKECLESRNGSGNNNENTESSHPATEDVGNNPKAEKISTLKKINDIARKFSMRRKSTKALKNVDPVFADCDDDDDFKHCRSSPSVHLKD